MIAFMLKEARVSIIVTNCPRGFWAPVPRIDTDGAHASSFRCRAMGRVVETGVLYRNGKAVSVNCLDSKVGCEVGTVSLSGSGE
jgi:hypothetical protein